jgi:hypothetical protein
LVANGTSATCRLSAWMSGIEGNPDIQRTASKGRS